MFIEKLNIKQEGVYVIEDEKNVSDGVYEGYLNHDNINHDTIYIYTEPKLKGEKVENYFLSTPSNEPWKTEIKVFSDSKKIYITYETKGDQVEAGDINLVQNVLEGEIDRSTQKDDSIAQNLEDEVSRSVGVDETIDEKLENEILRATNKDAALNTKINEEIERSEASESILNSSIHDEAIRAIAKENSLQINISNEVERATQKEEDLSNRIIDEIDRSIQKEGSIESHINSYIDSNNLEISRINDINSNLESKKTDKTYVDAELAKKYDKSMVYTKEEVLQRIQDIIGAAPEALDTLEEIAKALDNDPDFASNIINLLGTKVDKELGKELSTNDFTNLLKSKLDGVEEGSNKYIHPNTHSADMIVENVKKRFVSDSEKSTWNSKETPSGAQNKADVAESNAKGYMDEHDSNTIKHITSGERAKWNDSDSKKHTHSNKTVVDKITQGLLDGWDSAVEHIKDSVMHVTSTERSRWNTVNLKADKTYVDDKVKTDVPIDALFTDTVYKHPSNHSASIITESTTKRFVSDSEKATWDSKADKSEIPTRVGQLNNDKQFVTQSDLGSAGYGDMTKSIYDKDNSGVVDNAKKVNGFTVEKSVPANAKFTDTVYVHPTGTNPHGTTKADVGLGNVDNTRDSTKSVQSALYFRQVDTRDINENPQYYMRNRPNGVAYEFKRNSSIGMTSDFAGLPAYSEVSTYTSWGNSSGGYPVQLAMNNLGVFYRNGISDIAWGSWSKLATTSNIPTKTSQLTNDNKYLSGAITWNDLKGV